MSRFEVFLMAAAHRGGYVYAVANEWTPGRIKRYRDLTRIYQEARRAYVLSDELPMGSAWRSVCWRCRQWAPMYAQTVGGMTICANCGAEEPFGHRERLLEDLEIWEAERLAQLEASVTPVASEVV